MYQILPKVGYKIAPCNHLYQYFCWETYGCLHWERKSEKTLLLSSGQVFEKQNKIKQQKHSTQSPELKTESWELSSINYTSLTFFVHFFFSIVYSATTLILNFTISCWDSSMVVSLPSYHSLQAILSISIREIFLKQKPDRSMTLLPTHSLLHPQDQVQHFFMERLYCMSPRL